MIILDTNVVSEPTRPAPAPAVRQWLLTVAKGELFTTAITEAEMRGGVAAMSPGRRRDELSQQIHRIFAEDFEGQILPFDGDAARAFPSVARRVRGKFIIEPDSQIAAIALARGATLATRNIRHFSGRGLTLINPWTHTP